MKKVVKSEHATGQRADRRALVEINDLIDDGIYDAASVLAWEVQRTTPGDPVVWLLLARIDYLRERFAAAMYAARMATRLDPSSSDAWLALATTAVTRPRWRTEGLDAALQSTALAPSDPRTWTVLSQLQLLSGARYEAAVAAEQAVRVDPTDRGGHLMLGETALTAGELAYAEAAFRRVLQLDGSDPDARMGLVEALEAQGIDPADQLGHHGTPVALSGDRRPVGRSPRSKGDATARVAPASGRRVEAIVIVSSLALGLLIGLVVPGLGVVRGLVGAVALALMWVAVRPSRTIRPDPERAIGTDVDAEGVDGEADAGHAATALLGEASLARELAADVDAHDATHHAGSAGRDVAVRPSDDSADAGGGRDEVSVDAVDGRTGGGSDEVSVDAVDGRTGGGSDEVSVDAAETASSDDAADRGHAATPAIEMPDDPDELAELSRARLAASDVELAHAAASRLEAVAPDSLEAHRALGAVALAEQDYEEARQHYRRVLELEPLDQEAHERLALVGDAVGQSRSRLRLRAFRGRR